MKQAATAGTLSGCIIWMISIGMIASCILPIFSIIGSASSFSEFAIRITGKIICPDGTTPTSYSYQTTTTDEFGNSLPATGYELHCIDEAGTVVKSDPVGYAFLWVGLFALVGLIISIILAFLLAAPLGVMIGKLFKRTQRPNLADNIEPR
jgi:ABC-type glycerol-3-phosphate transport system permease component